MGKNSEINKLISNEETLFSEGSYEFPVLPQEDKPFYNPNINALYIPKFKNRLGTEIASIHELNHMVSSRFPAICFLQTLATLIYHEFSLKKYNSTTTISALLPENNPTVKMLKGIWEIVLNSTKYVLEAMAIPDSLDFNKTIIRKEDKDIDIKELQRYFVEQAEEELPGFEEMYSYFAPILRNKTIFRNIPTYYLNLFPLDGPSFFSKVPTKNGRLDGEKITEEIADEAVRKFRNVYQEFPYSPKKRLDFMINILEEMIENGVEITNKNVKKTIDERIDSNYKIFPELKGDVTEAEKCYHCPVKTLHSQGILIPWFDYGSVPNYDKRQKINKKNCTLSRKLGCDYSELSDEEKELSELNSFELIIDKNEPNKFNSIVRNTGYQANWPLSSFLTASEMLRYFVFNFSSGKKLFSRLTLTESIAFRPDHMNWGVPRQKPPISNKKQDFSPFISLRTIRAEKSEEEKAQMSYSLD